MPVKLKSAEEEYLPDVERRFLFDDVAVQEQQAHKAGSGPNTVAKELFKSDQVSLFPSSSEATVRTKNDA